MIDVLVLIFVLLLGAATAIGICIALAYVLAALTDNER